MDKIVSQSDEIPILDDDCVKRFSRPDVADAIRDLWNKHHQNQDVRNLLLRLIWLGNLKSCADLAVDTAFGHYEDRYMGVFACRALVATCDNPMKRKYFDYIKGNCQTLPQPMLWEAVDELFPDVITINELLDLLAAIDVTESHGGGLRFEWHGPKLVERVKDHSELKKLLQGLLQQVGGKASTRGMPIDAREKAYLPAITAAAFQLLTLCATGEAPIPTIDAVLRIGEHRREILNWRNVGDPAAELQRSAARRRIAFWRAAEQLSGNVILQGRPIESLWEMHILGWPLQLSPEDLDWVLSDGPTRGPENERRLSVNAALGIWQAAGKSDDLLARIKTAAETDEVMRQSFEAFLRPVERSAEEINLEKQVAGLRRQNESQQMVRDASWVEFIKGLRADPSQMKKLRPATSEGVDTRLFHLYRLLSETAGTEARYAVDTVAPLESILGPELTSTFRDALIGHWRLWRPRLKSTKELAKRNQISMLDCMGVAAVSLEAKTQPGWVRRLSSEEATLAAGYATVEINGFPIWIKELAAEKPQEVQAVLCTEVAAELADTKTRTRCEVLDDITRADEEVIRLVAPPLLEKLEEAHNLPEFALSPMLDIMSRGLAEGRTRFPRLIVERFHSISDMSTCALYVGAIFGVDPSAAMRALRTKLRTLGSPEKGELVQLVLPRIFGDRFFAKGIEPGSLPFKVLLELVRLAFQSVRVEEDIDHGGQVFSPNERDRAEQARGTAFKQLLDTPGRATYDALCALADGRAIPITPRRLKALARHRADKTPRPPHGHQTIPTPSKKHLKQRRVHPRISRRSHSGGWPIFNTTWYIMILSKARR